MEGQSAYYAVAVEEAAARLQVSPDRVREMLATGELEGIPPGGTAQGVWKVLLPATEDLQEPAGVEEGPREAASAEPQEKAGEFVEPPGTPPLDAEAPPTADEALPGGGDAAADREVSAPSGWVSTQQAARALGISPRTVRWHIEQGNLEAIPEGEGVRRSWLVSIDSLQSFRDARQAAGDMPRPNRGSAEGAGIVADSPGDAVRVLAERLEEAAARAAEYRVRLELTEQAESTLRAELEEAHRRREEAERDRDELRRQLGALRASLAVPEATAVGPPTPTPSPARQSPVSPTPSDTAPQSAAGGGGSQRPAQRPQRGRGLLRRLLGG